MSQKILRLVLLYWKDCGACHRIMPTWNTIRSSNLNDVFSFCDYESTQMEQIQSDYKRGSNYHNEVTLNGSTVNSFPTIKLGIYNHKTNMYDYYLFNELLTRENVIDFTLKKMKC